MKRMPAGCASSSCVTTLDSSIDGPYAVAVDASGNVYVTNTDDQQRGGRTELRHPPSLSFRIHAL